MHLQSKTKFGSMQLVFFTLIRFYFTYEDKENIYHRIMCPNSLLFQLNYEYYLVVHSLQQNRQ